MTDISGVLAGWEEARTNLGRKGSLRTIELRTAGQKVADALVDVNARKAAFRLRAERAEESLAACLERETQLREGLTTLLHYARPVDIQAAEIQGGADFKALASSVGLGAATEDGEQ